ncbi:hypothetical protein CesoFtcFv8_000701 [Champsocephalus esox]|uniref:Uncharacterized protein n=1 Tax=Champsocephalus esox TaxID=159716 RepID=A0AAN8D212_9TELE|nr:hypothetical protein CesoFtcFv8_000701 [Champsocephalus esox]
MSATCLFYLLSSNKLVSFIEPPSLHTAPLGRLVLSSGLRGAGGGLSDAASRSARVKGENSENRAFWSAGEDRPALFCMLESGQGVTQGVC